MVNGINGWTVNSNLDIPGLHFLSGRDTEDARNTTKV